MKKLLAESGTEGVEIEVYEDGFSIDGNFLVAKDLGESLNKIGDYLTLQGIDSQWVIRDLDEQLGDDED